MDLLDILIDVMLDGKNPNDPNRDKKTDAQKNIELYDNNSVYDRCKGVGEYKRTGPNSGIITWSDGTEQEYYE